jgi:Uncharacterized protein conserved in bacteria
MRRFFLYLAALFTRLLLHLVLKTCRVKIEGIDVLEEHLQGKSTILALWHNQLLLFPHVLAPYTKQRRFVAAVSASRDGDLLDTFIRTYPQASTIRIKHNRRHVALQTIATELNTSSCTLLITPDGPRGPRYKAKPGIAWIQKTSQANIVVFSWTANRYFELSSWDRLRIPRPFSKIVVSLKSVHLDDTLSDQMRLQTIQEAMSSKYTRSV